MGELDSIGLFDSAKNCEMEAQKPLCHNFGTSHTPDQLDNKSCCEDHSVTVEGQDELFQASNVSVSDFQLIAIAYVVVPQLFFQSSQQITPQQEYLPPLIQRDIPVLVQSFLL